MKDSSKFIQFAIQQGVLQFGEFTLKSGRVSPYFFNAGVFSDGESIAALSNFYAQAIVESEVKFDMLFGPAYKGIPLATAAAIALQNEHKINVPYAFNRKEAKEHGDGGQIVGAPIQGNVLIIDDVITAGTAINEAVDIIKQHGGTPSGVVVAFDRQEQGNTAEYSAIELVENQLGLQVIAVSNLSQLIQFAEQEQMYQMHLAKLRYYYEQYRPLNHV